MFHIEKRMKLNIQYFNGFILRLLRIEMVVGQSIVSETLTHDIKHTRWVAMANN